MTTRTTCPYCGVGCGVTATPTRLSGDAHHPANQGRLCVKGATLGDTLGLSGRLLEPQMHGQPVSWDTALDAVAEGLRRISAAHGPEAVAFYVSGQLLTEDYYVANKLIKGFLGTANIDTNSRLCMASSVAGHKRAFGEDLVPGCYADLEQAELVVLVGSNLAWCHPVLHQRLEAARKQATTPQVVVIDPRQTATCAGADLHLPLKPGTDTTLFNGLLVHLHAQGATDAAYLDRHTSGFAAALAAAGDDAPDIATVARRCGLSVAQVTAFYDLYTATARTVTVYSQGVNQSSCGTDKVNTIINCHLATGRIGRPGCGPFSVTGQPNAMGGREVGGLANQLAAHMDFTPEAIERVGRFWNAPRMATQPGLKAVDLFRAVRAGQVKAVWIMGTNPAVSLPAADEVTAALASCELVVVSDVVAATDTTRLAHILLPALAWGEKDGTVTNSERCLSRQRAFLPPPGQARADWWIISQVAQRLGFAAAFAYERPAQIFREHAALSAFENNGQRLFDLSGLCELSDAEYDALTPLQWPVRVAGQGTARLVTDGRYSTADGRARLIAVSRRAPAYAPDPDYPLVLNTGRVRDQWHTMTRTGSVPRLTAHRPEPYAELHPSDAAAVGIADGDLVQVQSRWGQAVLRARLSTEQQAGSVFAPMHWSWPYAGHSRIDAVVNPATDPVSGQPESKHTPVSVLPYRPVWQGFLLSRTPLAPERLAECSYWTAIPGREHWRYELAGTQAPAFIDTLLAESAGERLVYRDPAAGRYRVAAIEADRLLLCAFIGPDAHLPERDWLAGLFAAPLTDAQRAGLLRGAAAGQKAGGRTVCACFGVGVETLSAAIAGGCHSVEALGATLKAGTNCGSCIPELRALLAVVAQAEQVA